MARVVRDALWNVAFFALIAVAAFADGRCTARYDSHDGCNLQLTDGGQ